MSEKKSIEKTVQEIRQKIRKKYTVEEKIRIVLESLRGESTIAELCRREGINTNMYYKWSKEFLDAGKERQFLIDKVHRQPGNFYVNVGIGRFPRNFISSN